MGTKGSRDLLAAGLFGRTRQAVLSLLLTRPDESFYLREIARLTRVGQGALQRELSHLVRARVLQRSQRGRQVFFQANAECPVFRELQGIVLKTAGLVDVLRQALAPLADRIKLAFVFGSLARGAPRQGSDVDLCVVGEATFSEVVEALAPAQETLAREVNPTVYPSAEFRHKLAAGQHFVRGIWGEPKLVVVGDEREFAGLAEKQLDRSAPAKPAGNRRAARSGRS